MRNSIQTVQNKYAEKTNKKWESHAVVDGQPGETFLMSGCEAVARGAIEAGVGLATSYPGSPATYILENLANAARKYGFHAEWSTNEKVGFEAALGAAMCGVRAMSIFKTNGMNWIVDPLLCSYTMRTPGGLVLVVGDDPGANTSSNEGDSRWLGVASEIAILEPASYQDAKDLAAYAFELSEELQAPVLLRVVRQFLYGRGPVTLGEIDPAPWQRQPSFQKNPLLWAAEMGPRWENTVLMRHQAYHAETIPKLEAAIEAMPHNQMKIEGHERVGIIGSGMAYQAAVEAITQLDAHNEVATLKLCAANPLPRSKVETMLRSLESVLVVEEIEPVIETFVRDLSADLDRHAKILGKKTKHLPATDEMSAAHVAQPLAELLGKSFEPLMSQQRYEQAMTLIGEQITKRPQGALCPGCPEMGTMYALSRALRRTCKEGFISHGDIGCYERAIYPPWDSMHTIICMGAGPGLAHGMSRVNVRDKQIVQMGDGTFFHAALPELINAVYNGSSFTVVLYDNQCIGATGQQPHPGAFGLTAMRDSTGILSIEEIAASIGIHPIEVVDPFDLKSTRKALEHALAADGVSMVITRRACSIISERALGGRGKVRFQTYAIDQHACTFVRKGKCRECFDTLGCLAIIRDNSNLYIDQTFCIGCGLCEQVCAPDAIHTVEA